MVRPVESHDYDADPASWTHGRDPAGVCGLIAAGIKQAGADVVQASASFRGSGDEH